MLQQEKEPASTELATIPAVELAKLRAENWLANLPPAERAFLALDSEAKESRAAELVAQSKTVEQIADKNGRELAHTNLMLLVKFRTGLEREGKEVRADANAFDKAVIDECKRLTALTADEEGRMQTLRDAWDSAEEDRKAEEAAAEKARQDAHIATIKRIRDLPANAATSGRKSAGLRAMLGEIDGLLARDWQEYAAQADAAAMEARISLGALAEAAEAAEAKAAEEARLAEEARKAEEARLERVRAEQARIAEEQRQQAAALAAQQRALKEQAAALKRQQDAIEQAKRDEEARAAEAKRAADEAAAKAKEAGAAELVPVEQAAPVEQPAPVEQRDEEAPELLEIPAAATSTTQALRPGEVWAVAGLEIAGYLLPSECGADDVRGVITTLENAAASLREFLAAIK